MSNGSGNGHAGAAKLRGAPGFLPEAQAKGRQGSI
jgi:hypothetical protein